MRCDKYQKIQFRDNHHRDRSVRDLQAPSLNLKMSAASERYNAGHGPVGGGRISMPKSGYSMDMRVLDTGTSMPREAQGLRQGRQ